MVAKSDSIAMKSFASFFRYPVIPMNPPWNVWLWKFVDENRKERRKQFPLKFVIDEFFRSYDTRGSHAGTPSHWKDEDILENRAIFRTIRSPAELVIKPVKVREPSREEKHYKRIEIIRTKKKENFYSRSKNFIDFSSSSIAFRRRRTPATFGAALTLNFLQRGTAMWTFKL